MRGVHQDVEAAVPLERPDGDDQRPVHGAEFGPHLRRAPLGLLGRRRAAGPGQGDRGEPGVTRPAAAGPVHQEGSRAEDHGGRAYDPPLQHAQEVGAGPSACARSCQVTTNGVLRPLSAMDVRNEACRPCACTRSAPEQAARRAATDPGSLLRGTGTCSAPTPVKP